MRLIAHLREVSFNFLLQLRGTRPVRLEHVLHTMHGDVGVDGQDARQLGECLQGGSWKLAIIGSMVR